MRVFTLLIVSGAGLLAACARSDSPPLAQRCASNARRDASADSAVSLCVPPSYARRRNATWVRASAEVPDAFLSIQIDSLSVAADAAIWPRHLASSPTCVADCAAAEDLTVLHDSIAGAAAYVERGQLSGGFAGIRRLPALVASVSLSPTQRMEVRALAPTSAALDTLWTAVRTIRLTHELR